MSGRAWVTLATNDSYSLGALVLAHSLRRVESAHPTVALVTPGVTDVMRDRLQAVFAEVITVDVLDSGDAAHLALLARPELGITFTKLHCWTLTQYEKCVFLDADTLVLQNCDELFDREELSAAPDIGWPDCFNSGVFVYKPSQETFQALLVHATQRGSFDGGDQGLLNTFFSSWAHGDIAKHLPFLYNVCSTAFYSYLPALKQFGENTKIIHFIGSAKPWLQSFDWERRSVSGEGHLQCALQLWWDIFCAHVHSSLDITMAGIAGTFSQITLGAEGQQAAVDESVRRQGWEAGNVDYMGADSFTNIWAKISQTLSQAVVPREPSPAKEEESFKEAIPLPAPSTPSSESVPTELSVPKEPSPPKESSPSKELESPKEPSPLKEPEQPKEPSPVKEPEQPKEPSPLKEPEDSKEPPVTDEPLSVRTPKDVEIKDSAPEKESSLSQEEKQKEPTDILTTADTTPSLAAEIKPPADPSAREVGIEVTAEGAVSASGDSVTCAVKETEPLIEKSDKPSDASTDTSPVCPIIKASESKKPESKSQEEGEEETRL